MPSALIVGAGIFGASLAHRLSGDGWEVTIVDRDEPAGVRSTSGAHTRIIRCTHGPDAWHAQMARRARGLWREIEAQSGAELMVECGVAWLAHREDGWEAQGERVLRELGIPVERLDLDAVAALFPSFDPAGLSFAVYEPEGGALRARRAVETLVALAIENGARLVRAAAVPHGDAALVDGREMRADHIVWACGPWLGRLFPEHARLRVDRVEYATFDAGPSWDGTQRVPAWADVEADVYGIPSLDGAGFKLAPGGPPEPLRPRRRRPRADGRRRGFGAQVPGKTLPGDRHGAALGGSCVPVRDDRRRGVPDRPASRARARVAARRRVRATASSTAPRSPSSSATS